MNKFLKVVPYGSEFPFDRPLIEVPSWRWRLSCLTRFLSRDLHGNELSIGVGEALTATPRRSGSTCREYCG